MISDKGFVRLQDTLRALDAVASFIVGQTESSYLENLLLRSAVERQMEIVGEALSVFRRLDPKAAASIEDLPRATNFRNFLAHDYGSVDDEIVWQIATFYAPKLREAVAQLIGGAT